jgi:hypothetical protein
MLLSGATGVLRWGGLVCGYSGPAAEHVTVAGRHLNKKEKKGGEGLACRLPLGPSLEPHKKK